MHWLIEKFLIAVLVTGGVGGLGYCGYKVLVPTTVEDYLRLEGAKALTSDEDFAKVVKKHDNNGTTKMEGLGDISSKSDQEKTAEIRKKCKEIMETEYDTENFDKNKATAKDWCTDKSPHLAEEAKPVTATT